MFNALKYIKSLEAVGFHRDQAEAQVQLVIDAMNDEIATKTDMAELRGDMAELRSELRQDMAELRSEFKQDMAELRAEMKQDMAALRSELKQDMAALKSDLLLKLGGLMVGVSTVGFTALGVLITLK